MCVWFIQTHFEASSISLARASGKICSRLALDLKLDVPPSCSPRRRLPDERCGTAAHIVPWEICGVPFMKACGSDADGGNVPPPAADVLMMSLHVVVVMHHAWTRVIGIVDFVGRYIW